MDSQRIPLARARTRPRRIPTGAAAGVVTATVLVAALGVLVAGIHRADGDGVPAAAHVSAEHFLDRYMDPSGRVVRHDQGGDTVSEGQAYAMLAAVGIGDRRRFDRAWTWAHSHLRRRDGLMSWHWQGGRVADPGPAADADLDMARALVLAGRRFHVSSYGRAGARMARAILAQETVTVRGRPVLVAGPWARHAPYAVDPSYLSPAAFEILRRATGDRRFDALAASSRHLLSQLTSAGRSLPPDWATVDRSGAARPSGPPGGGGSPGYGFDAVRVPVRLAESCSSADRKLAARQWPSVRGAGGTHPAAIVGSAAAADAAGDHKAALQLLGEAEATDARTPTYYGAAWVALGRLELTSRVLGGC